MAKTAILRMWLSHEVPAVVFAVRLPQFAGIRQNMADVDLQLELALRIPSGESHLVHSLAESGVRQAVPTTIRRKCIECAHCVVQRARNTVTVLVIDTLQRDSCTNSTAHTAQHSTQPQHSRAHTHTQWRAYKL